MFLNPSALEICHLNRVMDDILVHLYICLANVFTLYTALEHIVLSTSVYNTGQPDTGAVQNWLHRSQMGSKMSEPAFWPRRKQSDSVMCSTDFIIKTAA